jgi:L-iditol 2-dehydrogenase
MCGSEAMTTVDAGTAGASAIPATMRAAVLFGPGDLRVVDKPVPRPGPGEVLVRVAMCGACGSDVRRVYRPAPSEVASFGQFTPGHEWTGTVAALGPTVDELAVGDRVAIHAHHGCGRCENCLLGMYTACLNFGNREKGHHATGITADGGFAQYTIHHASALYRLDERLNWEDAVLAMTAGTGLYGLDVAGGFIAGQSVAVIGPGPVGLMVAQACRALGAEPVIILGTRPARLDLARRLGLEFTVNVTEQDPLEEVKRLTDGLGVDLVIESSGAMGAPQQCVELVKRGGRVLFLAFYKEPVTFDLSRAIREDVTLFTSRGEGARSVKRALALMKQGTLRGRELVTHHFPLDQIAEGFRVLSAREGDPMKIVFVP